MKISRQTFYKRRKKQLVILAQRNFMKQKVLAIRRQQARIGGRKLIHLLQEDFKRAGIKIGRDKFFTFLKEEFLLVKRKKNRTITTRSYKRRFNCHPNRIKDLEIKRPEQVWVSDITYLNHKGGTKYLFLITDAYSKKIVGHYVSENMKTESGLKALNSALRKRRYPKRKLIHHSDRGFQYASPNYINRLKQAKIKVSMTTKYDPYENAVAERINGILKQEFSISDPKIPKKEVEKIVKNSINTYNYLRPHWSIHLLTPEEAHIKGRFKMKTYRKHVKEIVT